MASETFDKGKTVEKRTLRATPQSSLLIKRTQVDVKKWQSDFVGCGSVVNNALTSPGFPRKYPNNMHCVYNVSIPSGKALKINFATFELELHSGCG